jgi:hypothetical protein
MCCHKLVSGLCYLLAIIRPKNVWLGKLQAIIETNILLASQVDILSLKNVKRNVYN